MPWPLRSDYQDAVLSPQSSFDDPELKAGNPELTSLGSPRQWGGNFAGVYRIKCAQRDWAVKCFTQEIQDQHARYAAIDQYISGINSPYMVGFDYLSKGIRVRGQWYPILKMEWVRGELLSEYIERNLHNSSVLEQLASRWLAMLKALQANSIAHGDLQERNVLVVNDQLKLVDYDGMFVPSLSGQRSHEIGHPNYQHPLRTKADFGPFLDNFAAWVIYVSLVALSIDQGLWPRMNGGDECLLFRKADFEQPMLSQSLALLASHSNPNIRTLATLFRSMLFFPPHQVPSLNGQVPHALQSQAPGGFAQDRWWSDHAPTEQPKSKTEAAPGETFSQSASWVLDFVAPTEKVKARVFTQSMRLPRLVAFLSVNFLILAFGIGMSLPTVFSSLFTLDSLYSTRALLVLFVLTGMLVCLNGIVLVSYYSREPAVMEQGTFAARERKANEPQKQLEVALSNNTKEKTALQAEENQQKKKWNDILAHLRHRQLVEVDEVQGTLKKTISSIDSRRKTLDQEEQSKMRKLHADIGSKRDSLKQQILVLSSAESNEIDRELTTIQNKYVEDYLKSHSISDAPMAGLRYSSRSRLEQALLARGIYTAYDISYTRVDAVYGFGLKRTQALVGWRNQLEQQARFTMPRDLSLAVKNSIIAKYATQRKAWESQIDIEQAKFSMEDKTIREHSKVARHALDTEQAIAQTQSTQKTQELNKRYAQEFLAPTQAQAQLAKEFGDKYHELNEQNNQLRQQMFSVSWQIAKLHHEHAAYKDVTFSQYVEVVFLGHRAQ